MNRAGSNRVTSSGGARDHAGTLPLRLAVGSVRSANAKSAYRDTWADLRSAVALPRKADSVPFLVDVLGRSTWFWGRCGLVSESLK